MGQTITPNGKPIVSVETEFAGRKLTLEVGRVGFRTSASVVARYGDTVVLGTAMVGGSLSRQTVSLTIAWWLQRLSISLMKDYGDVKGDAQHHKLTFYRRFGAKTTGWTSIVTAALGWGLALYTVGLGQHASWVTVLIAVVGLAIRSRLLGATRSGQQRHVFRQSFYIQLLFEGSVLTCLL